MIKCKLVSKEELKARLKDQLVYLEVSLIIPLSLWLVASIIIVIEGWQHPNNINIIMYYSAAATLTLLAILIVVHWARCTFCERD